MSYIFDILGLCEYMTLACCLKFTITVKVYPRWVKDTNLIDYRERFWWTGLLWPNNRGLRLASLRERPFVHGILAWDLYRFAVKMAVGRAGSGWVHAKPTLYQGGSSQVHTQPTLYWVGLKSSKTGPQVHGLSGCPAFRESWLSLNLACRLESCIVVLFPKKGCPWPTTLCSCRVSRAFVWPSPQPSLDYCNAQQAQLYTIN